MNEIIGHIVMQCLVLYIVMADPIMQQTEIKFELVQFLFPPLIWYTTMRVTAQQLMNLEIPVLAQSLKSSNIKLG